MARLKKNGNLSGAIGNIVFVNDGARIYVRTMPDKVRQTKSTKAAASIFGEVSRREKLLRNALLSALQFPALQYFAAKHRARIRKTVETETMGADRGLPTFGNSQPLQNFDFNPHMEWAKYTNFFPEIVIGDAGNFTLKLPDTRAGKEIKFPKWADRATLKMVALSVHINHPNVPVETVFEHSFELAKNSKIPAESFSFRQNNAEEWLLLCAAVQYKGQGATPGNSEAFSGSYLWVK